MSSDRLERVKEVLDGALARDHADRAEYVEGACRSDETLRREVEALLAQEGVAAPLLESPIFSLRAAVALGPEPTEEGRRIGPYQVVRKLGEGGMGTVLLAVREDDFEKRVALKVIKRSALSEEALRRFHNERQILAQLEHPSIARILDGGTTEDGLPYFAMEQVEGEPIDAYCDRRWLSIRQRLELFRRVCVALQVAHQNLVVHRDLKPGNILVTGEGVPKLLDFGIAKRLTPEPSVEVTDLDRRPMTLRYASPEQIEGRPITTASDVYSLGVLLYQLLTGSLPYPVAGDSEARLIRAICDEEPSKPSAAVVQAVEVPERDIAARRLRRRLAGDLDSIVLRALRKDPRRRYSSVEQLSEDIRRHLEGLPVAAREGTFSYRAVKFVLRNRGALALGASFALLALVFASTTTVLWRQAARERDRSEGVVHFLKSMFDTAKPDIAQGQRLSPHDILSFGLETIDVLQKDPLHQADLLSKIGEVYVDLGLYEEARVPLQRALDLHRRVHGSEHPGTVGAVNDLAGVYFRSGDYRRARELYEGALRTKRGMDQPELDLEKSMSNLATILMTEGELEAAERLYVEALERRKQQHGPEDPDVAVGLRSLGNLYYVQGDLERAEPLLRESLEIRLKRFGPDDTKVATALVSLGRVLHGQGRHWKAEELFLRALEIRRARLGDDHVHVASVQRDLAALFLDVGEPEVAEVLLVRALATFRDAKGEGAWEIADTESLLGAWLAGRGRYEEAEPCLVESYRALLAIRGERAIHTRAARRRVRDLYIAWGKTEKAVEYMVATERYREPR